MRQGVKRKRDSCMQEDSFSIAALRACLVIKKGIGMDGWIETRERYDEQKGL